MSMTAIVALGCRACGSKSSAEVPAEPCSSGSPFHVHIKADDDNPVARWYSSHHQPGSMIVAVRNQKETP